MKTTPHHLHSGSSLVLWFSEEPSTFMKLPSLQETFWQGSFNVMNKHSFGDILSEVKLSGNVPNKLFIFNILMFRIEDKPQES